MTDRDAFHRFSNIALKWRELAERRRAHFTELYKSGRWKRYYSEADLVLRMREVIAISERWATIAPQATDKVPPVPAKKEPVPQALHRTAA
jgi:uncharacterized repeat protein (TIGR03809 family)